MTQFGGIYEHKIGDKYRISIPSGIRARTSKVSLFLYDRGESHLLYLLPDDFEGGLEQYTQHLQEQAPNPLNGDFDLETMLRAVDVRINIQELKLDRLGRTMIRTLKEKGVKPGQKI